MSAGKGSKPRPTNGEKYRKNFDRIFRKKRLPKYVERYMKKEGGGTTIVRIGTEPVSIKDLLEETLRRR